MARLVKRNRSEHVKLRDDPNRGSKPRLTRGMRRLLQVVAPDIKSQETTSQTSKCMSDYQPLPEDTQSRMEKHGDLTSVSMAAWRPFRGLMSRFITQKRKTKETPNKPSVPQPQQKRCLFLSIPVELLQTILDHLDPIDRAILRYTCKALNRSICTAADHPLQREDKRAKARIIARLLDSALCPRFMDDSHTRFLNKEEILALIRSKSECSFCELFSLGEQGDNEYVRCPFHVSIPSMQKGGAPEASSTPTPSYRKLWKRDTWKKQKPTNTFDDYVEGIKREAAWAPTGPSTEFEASFASTWKSTLLTLERLEQGLSRKSSTDSQQQVPIAQAQAHGASLDPVNKLFTTVSRNQNANQDTTTTTTVTVTEKDKDKDTEPDHKISTLNCCCHCMNVLPNNSHVQRCIHCDCTQCGWTSVRLLRYPEVYRGEHRVRYIPLGHVVGDDDGDAETNGKKTSVKAFGRRMEWFTW